MVKTKNITIFEGPDGSGKTTAAKKFAQNTDALYVHLDRFPGITANISRLYYEAMLPALLGYQDVVMDRCWISEPIYGYVFRHGVSRCSYIDIVMLERLAMRCGALLVMCKTDYPSTKKIFLDRINNEMLEDDEQLGRVYARYNNVNSSLPTIDYDYKKEVLHVDDSLRYPNHDLDILSSGNLNAPTIIILNKLEDYTSHESFYRYAGVSFSEISLTRNLTKSLPNHGKDPAKICWVSADQPLELMLKELSKANVIALYEEDSNKLSLLGIRHHLADESDYFLETIKSIMEVKQ